MKKQLLILLFSVLSLSLWAQKHQHRVDNPLDTVKAVWPNAASIKTLNSIWSVAVDTKGKQLGYVFNSTAYGQKIMGYMEDVPILVMTDLKYKILKVAIINSKESPAYLAILYRKRFFDQFKGQALLKIDTFSADAVSGATLSSEAVIETLQLVGQKASTTKPK